MEQYILFFLAENVIVIFIFLVSILFRIGFLLFFLF